ncbi:MAG: cytochrome c [Gammaproteobacteria bacterium]|nr:cytochrome c [Gammaproteobacteria bacterium]
MLGLVGLCGLAASPGILADDHRARQNYLIYCMGCHGEQGDGFKDQVPSMRGTLARLAVLPEGRSFLLRVPGVSQSSLDAELTAEVLNWALREFSDAGARQSIPPFTADEVAQARARPLLEVSSARAQLLRGEGLDP